VQESVFQVSHQEQRDHVSEFMMGVKDDIPCMGNCLLDRMYKVVSIAEHVVELNKKEKELEERMKALEEHVNR